MKLQRFDDVRAFAQRAEPFLLANEAAHCLALGLLTTLQAQPDAFGLDAPYCALVEDDAGAIVQIAMRTPPFNVILSLPAVDANVDNSLALIAADTQVLYPDLPGVLGPAPLSTAFAAEWERRTGTSSEIGMCERIYQIQTVIPVEGVPGNIRRATASDREIVADWIAAFSAEAHTEPVEPLDWADRVIAADAAMRGMYLWQHDGSAVSFAGYNGPTAHGIRIGPVYTPPELRGHGYASAVTAALTRMLLDGGRQSCFLFTDLSNPTSNKIYQTIGYRPVVDVNVYRFGATS
jgi:GNAT superfamily N-acetyltransferase